MLFGNPVRGRIGRPGHPDPTSRFVVTQPFKGESVHDGLDIDNGGPVGEDPIIAIRRGTVAEIRKDSNGALIVRLNHADGWSSGYGHLHEFRVTKVGQVVRRGETIGLLGDTGLGTGPHVHFDISRFDPKLGRVVRRDPWPLLEQNHPRKEDWMPLRFASDSSAAPFGRGRRSSPTGPASASERSSPPGRSSRRSPSPPTASGGSSGTRTRRQPRASCFTCARRRSRRSSRRTRHTTRAASRRSLQRDEVRDEALMWGR